MSKKLELSASEILRRAFDEYWDRFEKKSKRTWLENPGMGRPIIFQRKKVREVATIEELEKRIKKLEERIFIQDRTINKILDLVQKAIGAQAERKSADYEQSEQDQEQFKKESSERMNKIMEELGYKTE